MRSGGDRLRSAHSFFKRKTVPDDFRQTPGPQGPGLQGGCLGGRASYMTTEHAEHIFAPLSPGAQNWNLFPFGPGAGWDTRLNDGSCQLLPRLWSVQTSALEILRTVVGATAPLSQSQLDAVMQGQIPAGASISAGNVLSLRAHVQTQGGTRVINLDPGQCFEVLARKIDVFVRAPTGSFLVQNEPPSAQTLSNAFVVDSKVFVGINEVEDNRGNSHVIWTQHITGPAAGNVVVPVPPFATEVSVSQNTAGGAPVQFELFVGDPTVSARTVATIGFTGRQALRFPTFGASHIRTNTDAAARVYTFVWTIKV